MRPVAEQTLLPPPPAGHENSLVRTIQMGFDVLTRLSPEARGALHLRERKSQSVRKLAEAWRIPPSTLWRALAVYAMYCRYPEIGSYRHVGVGHASLVLAAGADLQLQLLRRAEQGSWSRQMLARQLKLQSNRTDVASWSQLSAS